MICIKELEELRVLFGVFYNLKFKTDAEEIEKLVRSPYFSNIFNKTLLEMVDGYQKANLNITSLNNWYLDESKDEFIQIKNYLLAIENWNEMELEAKYEIIKILFSPFLYDNTLVNEVMFQIETKNG